MGLYEKQKHYQKWKTEVLAKVNYLQFCNKGSHVTRVSLCTEWNFGFKKHFSKFQVVTKKKLKKKTKEK